MVTPIFEKYAKLIKTTPNIYKSLYIGDPKRNEDEIKIKAVELNSIIENCYKECETQEKKLRALNIYILGLNHVGKSSIVKQLNKEQFDPNIKPTLGKEVIRVVFENTDMDILDVGGDKDIEELWKENPNPPEAIVFVLDYTAGKEHYKQSNEEFKKIMKFFFGKNVEHTLPKTTPVLILASKVDSVKDVNKQFLEKLLNPKKYGINYRAGYVSAKMEEGVYDNFRWIIQEFLKYI
jgi:GTPase SAR1 family protein